MATKSKKLNPEYPKGAAPIGGINFEVGLQTLFSLSGIQCFEHSNWRLSNENQEAGKFDDLVFESNQGDILLQAKIKQNKILTENQFLSDNPSNADFSLAKYLLSYKCIKSFNIRYLLLCTNADVPISLFKLAGSNEHNMIRKIFGDCKIYYIEQSQRSKIEANIAQFKENIQPEREKKEKTDWKKLDITENDIELFISKFLCVRISERQIKTQIQDKLNNLNRTFPISTYEYITDHVREWYTTENNKAVYLTNTFMKLILYGEESRNALKYYLSQPISFNQYQFDTYNPIIIKAEQKPEWHLTKIIQGVLKTYENKPEDIFYNEMLFVSSNNYDTINDIIECFKIPHLKHLVICLTEFTEQQILKTYITILDILQHYPKKKVFVVVKTLYSNLVNSQGAKIIDDQICFNSLDHTSRQKLLNTEIVFQGCYIKLGEIINNCGINDVLSKIDETMIRNLIETRKYSFGETWEYTDVQSYYITRNLSSDGHLFSEEEFLHKIRKTVVVLSGSPGAGKTTLLKKLITNWRKEKPLRWIINLDLSKTINYLEKRDTDSTFLELLIDIEAIKVEFEVKLFKYLEKIIVIDGIDETNSKYIERLQTLVAENLNLNISTVVMATRNYDAIIKKLRAYDIEFLTLESFSDDNQLKFFKDYVTSTGLEDNSLSTMVNLFKKLTLLTPEIKQFCSNPLTLKMIIEILRININNPEVLTDTFREKMSKYEFFNYFLDERKKLFVKEKCKCSQYNCQLCAILGEAFNGYLNNLKLLAAHSSFSTSLLDSFYIEKLEINSSVLHVGVLDEQNDQFNFSHKSFEEYFAAQYIWSVFMKKKLTKEVLLDILSDIFLNIQYSGVSDFFEGILETTKSQENDILLDISKKYSVILNQVELDERRNISNLAFYGHINIIKLLFENYEKFSDVINIRGVFGQTAFHLSAHFPNLVIYLTEKGADINCIDDNKFTIFHYVIMMCWDSEKYKIYFNNICEKMKNPKPLKSTIFLEEYFKLLQRSSSSADLCKTDWNDILELIVYLQERGLNVHTLDKDLDTYLHWIAQAGLMNIFTYFTEVCKMDINVYNSQNRTPLHYACEFGAIDIVKYLKNLRADLNVVDKNGWTTIHMAAAANAINVLKYLIHDCGIEPNTKDNLGTTPLHYAAEKGWLDALKYLEEVGLSLNEKTNEGFTPLHFAASGNAVNILKYLTENRCMDPNIRDSVGNTPLHYAAQKGSLDVLKYLISKGLSLDVVNNNGLTLVHMAAGGNAVNVLKYLLDQNNVNSSIPDTFGITPLQCAVHNGSLDAFKYLEMHNVPSVNDSDNKPVHIAATGNAVNILKYLIEDCKIDPITKNKSGNTPLHFAAEGGSIDSLKYLIENCNVNPTILNKFGDTALHYAVKKGSLDSLKYLESKGSSLTAVSYDGNTAIHMAALGNAVNVLEYLIDDCKIDPAVGNNLGNTPLHFAAEGGALDVIKYFKTKGLSFDITNKIGATLIHKAAWGNAIDVLKYLIQDCNMNPAITEIRGQSPLHYAAKTGSFEAFQFLEATGLDLKSVNNIGDTLIHMAAWGDATNILKYLIEDCNMDPNVANQFEETAIDYANQNRSHAAQTYLESKMLINTLTATVI